MEFGWHHELQNMTTIGTPRALARQTEQPAGDDEILALFQRWRDAVLAIRNIASRHTKIDDPELDAAAERLCEVGNAICDAQASCTAGLAIKAYILLVRLLEGYEEGMSPGSVTLTEDDYGFDGVLLLTTRAAKGLASDLARFVPELAPLVARVAEAPVRLAPRPPGGSKDGPIP